MIIYNYICSYLNLLIHNHGKKDHYEYQCWDTSYTVEKYWKRKWEVQHFFKANQKFDKFEYLSNNIKVTTIRIICLFLHTQKLQYKNYKLVCHIIIYISILYKWWCESNRYIQHPVQNTYRWSIILIDNMALK